LANGSTIIAVPSSLIAAPRSPTCHAEELIQLRFVDSHGRLFQLLGAQASTVVATDGPPLEIDSSRRS
jgi:hypothetical protein